jgi:hypothetical protein
VSYYSDDCPRPSSLNVDGPPETRWSGLYDAKGEKLYELRPPMGFGHHHWNPYA